MARFLLALIIIGVAARTNAWPYPGDIPGDDEDGYDVDIPLSDVCRQGFIDNKPTYENGFVNFMLHSICPSLFDEDEEGSGYGLQLLANMEIAQIVDQEILTRMDESTCKSEGQVQRLNFFCRFYQDGIKVSGVDGGSGSGNGDGNGDTSGSGDGSGDGGYGFSVYWSSMVDGGSFW